MIAYKVFASFLLLQSQFSLVLLQNDTTQTIGPPDCTELNQRFPHPRCDSYYECVDICNTKSFTKYPFKCPPNMHYDPNNRGCSSSYQCSDPESPTPPDPCDEENLVMADPKNNLAYFSCHPTIAKVLKETQNSCTFGYYFDSKTSTCKKDDGSRDFSECNSASDSYQQHEECYDPNDVKGKILNYTSECEKCGVFADMLSCQRYFICQDCDGILVKQPNTCPYGMQFCPVRKCCVPSPGPCPCTAQFTYNCTTEGTFADTTCPAYYYTCEVEYVQDYYVTYNYCPPGTTFCNKKQTCVPKCVCPCKKQGRTDS